VIYLGIIIAHPRAYEKNFMRFLPPFYESYVLFFARSIAAIEEELFFSVAPRR